MSHKVNKYPDGTSYVNEVSLQCHPFRINSYEDLWHLNQYVDAFKSQHGIAPNILIPNLIDAQADRRFNVGESSGLKLVLKFLNSMDVKQFIIFHPHNPEVVETMLDNVNIWTNESFIRKVKGKLIEDKFTKSYDQFQQTSVESNMVLMSSDAGGFKPLMKLCDRLQWKGDTYSASKARKWENKESKLTQVVDRDDFKGKDVLIIDDICVYGGTFKGLAKMLKERNVGKLYLAVSHMTIQNHKGDDTVFKYFDKVFTTNSKFQRYFIEDGKGQPQIPNNLEMINLF